MKPIIACLGLLILPLSAHALPHVIVTGVAVDNDSFKVQYQAFPGAADYRIVDLSAPLKCKYSGEVHPKVHGKPITEPSLEIEQNGIAPGVAHTFVIEAVDHLGPAPKGNQYDKRNEPLISGMADHSMCMLGSNMGMTEDGFLSTNGQGPWDNLPAVIARSDPFTVTTEGVRPSIQGATQVFMDDFAGGVITQTRQPDTSQHLLTYKMKTWGGHLWDAGQLDCDQKNTKLFIMNRHLMDVAFDGYEPHTGKPMHIAHGITFFSPKPSSDISGGKILHVTMEVDAHVDSRRWVAFNLAPAGDPLTAWYTNKAINNSNTAAFIQIFNNTITVDQYTGSNANGRAASTRIFGAAGQALHYSFRKVNGRGLDDRSRFDFFTSTTHFALFEDGVNKLEGDWAQPLPFTNVKSYFTHYIYHTALEVEEIKKFRPMESYWMNITPYSSEAHWDNMGTEVLPAGTDFSSLADKIKMPPFTPPKFVDRDRRLLTQ